MRNTIGHCWMEIIIETGSVMAKIRESKKIK